MIIFCLKSVNLLFTETKGKRFQYYVRCMIVWCMMLSIAILESVLKKRFEEQDFKKLMCKPLKVGVFNLLKKRSEWIKFSLRASVEVKLNSLN